MIKKILKYVFGVPTIVLGIYIAVLFIDRALHACPDVAIYVYCPEG